MKLPLKSLSALAALTLASTTVSAAPMRQPPPPIEIPMELSGTVTPQPDGSYAGIIRDDGNCWHPVAIDLRDQTMTTWYVDLPIPGCPDAPDIRHLTNQADFALSVGVDSPDAGAIGQYTRGPTCLSRRAYGTWWMGVPHEDGSRSITMHGWRTLLYPHSCNEAK